MNLFSLLRLRIGRHSPVFFVVRKKVEWKATLEVGTFSMACFFSSSWISWLSACLLSLFVGITVVKGPEKAGGGLVNSN